MMTLEELTAKRLKWAMRPINLYGQLFIPSTFIWRIGAILGKSRWQCTETFKRHRTFWDSNWTMIRIDGAKRLINVEGSVSMGKWSGDD